MKSQDVLKAAERRPEFPELMKLLRRQARQDRRRARLRFAIARRPLASAFFVVLCAMAIDDAEAADIHRLFETL